MDPNTNTSVSSNSNSSGVIVLGSSNAQQIVIHKNYIPSSWLTSKICTRFPYFPQLGDDLMYLRQGHEMYISKILTDSVYQIPHAAYQNLPFIKYPDLPDAVPVRVTAVKFEIKPPRIVSLELTGLNTSGDTTRITLNVFFHDIDGVVDFLVLRQLYLKSINRDWQIGSRFRCLSTRTRGYVWGFGVITAINPFSPKFPNSHFLSYTYVGMNGNTGLLSPWQFEDIPDGFVAPNGGEVFGVPADLCEISDPYTPSANEWPHSGDRVLECSRISPKFKEVMLLWTARQFRAPVDFALYPEYAYTIPYPMDLGTIIGRLDSRFYRRLDALKFDINYIASNADDFNKPRSDIVRYARIIRDLCLAICDYPITSNSVLDVTITCTTISANFQWEERDCVVQETIAVIPRNTNSTEPVPGSSSLSATKVSTSSCQLQTDEDDIVYLPPPENICTSAAEVKKSNWRRRCTHLLNKMWNSEDGLPFRYPVDMVTYPEYYKFVNTPMDFHSIHEDLTGGNYKSPLEFSRDVRLIFSNCAQFNVDENTPIRVSSERLSRYFQREMYPICDDWRRRRDKSSPPKTNPHPHGPISDSELEIRCVPLASIQERPNAPSVSASASEAILHEEAMETSAPATIQSCVPSVQHLTSVSQKHAMVVPSAPIRDAAVREPVVVEPNPQTFIMRDFTITPVVQQVQNAISLSQQQITAPSAPGREIRLQKSPLSQEQPSVLNSYMTSVPLVPVQDQVSVPSVSAIDTIFHQPPGQMKPVNNLRKEPTAKPKSKKSSSSVTIDEFRWNLKLLLRAGFPEGLALHSIESQYKHWLEKVVTPQIILPAYATWKLVFTSVQELKETFNLFRREGIDHVRVRSGPAEPDELKMVLRLANYSKYTQEKVAFDLERTSLLTQTVQSALPSRVNSISPDSTQNHGLIPPVLTSLPTQAQFTVPGPLSRPNTNQIVVTSSSTFPPQLVQPPAYPILSTYSETQSRPQPIEVQIEPTQAEDLVPESSNTDEVYAQPTQVASNRRRSGVNKRLKGVNEADVKPVVKVEHHVPDTESVAEERAKAVLLHEGGNSGSDSTDSRPPIILKMHNFEVSGASKRTSTSPGAAVMVDASRTSDDEVPGPSSHMNQPNLPLSVQISGKMSFKAVGILQAHFGRLMKKLEPQIVKSFVPRSNSRMEPVLERAFIEDMDIPTDWMVFPLQGAPRTDNSENRGFYKNGDGNKTLRLQSSRADTTWIPCSFASYGSKQLYLPQDTLVYGEIVHHSKTEKWPLTVFHIIDTAVLGGIDVRKKSFATRRRLCLAFMDSYMTNITEKDCILIKMKPAVEMLKMVHQIIDKVVTQRDKDREITCIPDMTYDGREPLVPCTGLLFMKVTENWEDADFMSAMKNRYYWEWQPKVSLCRNKLSDRQHDSELGIWVFINYFRRFGVQDTDITSNPLLPHRLDKKRRNKDKQ